MTLQQNGVEAWEPFHAAPSDTRAQVLASGRAACRRAFVRAAGEWSQRFGAAPWCDAPFDHEEAGAPTIAFPNAPRISLCHCRGMAGCAIAAPGHEWVGIDAEHVEASALAAVRQDAIRSREEELPWPHADWPARLWCAKESVVKAERIGADLLGRTLKVVQVLPCSSEPHSVAPCTDIVQLLVESHRGNTFRVSTGRIGLFVTACVRERVVSDANA